MTHVGSHCCLQLFENKQSHRSQDTNKALCMNDDWDQRCAGKHTPGNSVLLAYHGLAGLDSLAAPSSSPLEMVHELHRGEDTDPSDPRLPPKPEVAVACNSDGNCDWPVPAKPETEADASRQAPQGPSQCTNANNASNAAKWGILLPTCSRGKDAATCWQDLGQVSSCLECTTAADERTALSLHIGIDQGDGVYDSTESITRLQQTFSAFGNIHIHKLEPAYRGKICWIWEKLADEAVRAGAEYFVLLGDDIDMRSQGWKRNIEETFQRIASERALPIGIACVAFQDEAFPVFPTFPVLHRRHFDVFGRLFPRQLINQHGDPFVFEVYRRFGASVFAPGCVLCNTVGGRKTARYTKESSVPWRDELLTEDIHTLDAWLADQLETTRVEGGNGAKENRTNRMIPCIDVVVPTYRCDVDMLARICNLEAATDASICKLIVVDKPDAHNLHDVLALQSYRENDLVRVYVMEKNEGAGEARNKGLSQSFGDYAVLLDDDVVPEDTLLDA
jgi:hypothetical protein